ncbi:hypothetical protein M2T36_25450, partial [Escherichia coli]|uniref:hypothetical protein n=1 Tax=Escherichia coli TaxID=562 RepID=UPI00200D0516
GRETQNLVQTFIMTDSMKPIDLFSLRAPVQAMDYLRGTPDEVALWREDNEDSRANLLIEGFLFEPDEDAMFDMFLEEGVPPSLVPSIILTLYGQDATAPDRAAAP